VDKGLCGFHDMARFVTDAPVNQMTQAPAVTKSAFAMPASADPVPALAAVNSTKKVDKGSHCMQRWMCSFMERVRSPVCDAGEAASLDVPTQSGAEAVCGHATLNPPKKVGKGGCRMQRWMGSVVDRVRAPVHAKNSMELSAQDALGEAGADFVPAAPAAENAPKKAGKGGRRLLRLMHSCAKRVRAWLRIPGRGHNAGA
jgi:hypothetical protein